MPGKRAKRSYREIARMKCSPAVLKAELKRALRDLVSDMGYSSVNRVPKHMRVALRSHAESLAATRCVLGPRRR